MMKYLNASFLLSIVLLNAGCKDSADQPEEGKVSSSSLDRIYLSVASDEERATPETDSDFDEKGVLITKFDEVSTLFISQRNGNQLPFKTRDNTYPFTYMGEEADASANWDEGYNFYSSDTSNPLTWETIEQTEKYLNAYALYALYYPTIDMSDWNQETILDFTVPRDQSDLEALKMADILGAFHNSDLYSRLRFRLYHLMVYLKINLYVPVYDEEKKTGFTINADPSLTIEGASNSFDFDWGIIRDSDGMPPVISTAIPEGIVPPFLAHKHEVENERPEVSIDYTEYTKLEQGVDSNIDKVLLYEFSVIIPMQDSNFLYESTTEGADPTPKNFLKVEINSPITGLPKTYYLNPTLTLPNSQSQLSMEAGNLQVLNLYLPRKGSSLIMMGATVDPWGDLYSEFPLIEQ